MTHFIPGLQLCEAFYHEAVRPVLDRHFLGLAHAARQAGWRLGGVGVRYPALDGPRLGTGKADPLPCRCRVRCVAYSPLPRRWREYLPHEFRGFSTDFARSEVEGGSRVLRSVAHGPVAHGITITTVGRFFLDYLGVDVQTGLREVDWWLIPQQRLRTVACGRIFHDGLAALAPARDALRWYPHDLWCYLLACQWQRISQEEPFMARCGDVGDELGSRLVASRMVTELMRLCFLMERTYWPYNKWFGSAFSRLACADELTPIFHAVFDSHTWQAREQQLSAAYVALAHRHNALGLTEIIEPEVSPFFDRPYQVPHAGRFVEALRNRITSDTVQNLPPHVGAVAQFVDSTDILDVIDRCQRLDVLYR